MCRKYVYNIQKTVQKMQQKALKKRDNTTLLCKINNIQDKPTYIIGRSIMP